MSHYADYIRERENKSIIETEKGFATFKITEEICYIEDIYIEPYSRQSKSASKMADEIAEYAKKEGCKWLVGSVNPATNNATQSLKVLLGYGMTLDSINNGLIWFRKEI